MLVFNHYDDPWDDEWDEAPLVPSRPPAHPPPASTYASMVLDRGLLPISLRLSPHWHDRVAGEDAADELLRVYESTVEATLFEAMSTGQFAGGEFRHACGFPDRRTVLALLLEASSWPDYRAVQDEIATRNRFEVHGRAQVDREPVVTLRADCFQVRTLEIWPEWAERAAVAEIADEVLCCADQIRSLRPAYRVRGDYSRYSDEDLEYHHLRHREYLIEGMRT
ncbi:hypothetical protein ACFVMC_30190 [Nocardia sp. NPDC127579]|uniref:hypothetical protein n=1 Tax=Nocardia sp. NPDC127579 TaxID=3345402 RepID=UPI0036317EE0